MWKMWIAEKCLESRVEPDDFWFDLAWPETGFWFTL